MRAPASHSASLTWLPVSSEEYTGSVICGISILNSLARTHVQEMPNVPDSFILQPVPQLAVIAP